MNWQITWFLISRYKQFIIYPNNTRANYSSTSARNSWFSYIFTISLLWWKCMQNDVREFIFIARIVRVNRVHKSEFSQLLTAIRAVNNSQPYMGCTQVGVQPGRATLGRSSLREQMAQSEPFALFGRPAQKGGWRERTCPAPSRTRLYQIFAALHLLTVFCRFI